MFSALDMVNAALAQLAIEPIPTLDSLDAEASVARRVYPTRRDALLSLHPWSFSTATRKPQRIAAEDIRYRWPNDALRLIGLWSGGRKVSYRLSAPLEIVAAEEADALELIVRTDEALWPPFFGAALVDDLTAAMCVPLTEDAARALKWREQAEFTLRRARLADSQQNPPRRLDDAGDLIAVRNA